MHILVHHDITDPQQWEENVKRIGEMIEHGQLPKGLKGLMYLPSTDGRHATCLWEAPTLLALRVFLDREAGMAANNDYSEVKEDAAFGLPGREMMRNAA